MSTYNVKLYFPSSGSPAITPAYSSFWDDTSAAVRRPIVPTTPSGTSWAAQSFTGGAPGVSVFKVLLAQYIFGPLPAGSFLQGSPAVPLAMILNPIARVTQVITPSGYAGGGHIIAHGARTCFRSWIAKPDATVRGVYNQTAIFGPGNGFYRSTGSPFTFAYQAQAFGGSLVDGFNIVVQAGDYAVLEFGFWIKKETVSGVNITGYTAYIQFGDETSQPDLSVGSLAAGNAWTQYNEYVTGTLSTPTGVRWRKPLAPTHTARVWQSPQVADRTNDILNEFIL